MFGFRWVSCFLVLLSFFPLLTFAKTAPSVALLEASGGGATADMAKEKALANLGAQVLVRVQSHARATTTVHRLDSYGAPAETVEQQSMDSVAMDSRLFFSRGYLSFR